ncbi:MAG: hypothetical protein WDW38_005469 [Sanguina aurantia]
MGADYPDGGVPSQRKSSAGVFTSSELPYIPTAIFPHGSHKPKIRVVSDRAIKHVHELTQLHEEGTRPGTPLHQQVRCGILFVVNRADCGAMRPCDQADRLFAQVVKRAEEAGVLLLAYDIVWDGGKAYVGKQLPVIHGSDIRSEDIDEAHLLEWLAEKETCDGTPP